MDSTRKTFRSCGTDIEFSINVEYNGWWLAVHPIALQSCYIPDGVGILPSTVVLNFLVSHEKSHGLDRRRVFYTQVYIFSAAISAVALALASMT